MLDKVTAVSLPHSFGTYPSNLLAPSWSEMTDTANRFINCVSTEDTSKSPTPAQQAQTARISEHCCKLSGDGLRCSFRPETPGDAI